jgi:hypothetical protein
MTSHQRLWHDGVASNHKPPRRKSPALKGSVVPAWKEKVRDCALRKKAALFRDANCAIVLEVVRWAIIANHPRMVRYGLVLLRRAQGHVVLRARPSTLPHEQTELLHRPIEIYRLHKGPCKKVYLYFGVGGPARDRKHPCDNGNNISTSNIGVALCFGRALLSSRRQPVKTRSSWENPAIMTIGSMHTILRAAWPISCTSYLLKLPHIQTTTNN